MSNSNTRFAVALDEERQTLYMQLSGRARFDLTAIPVAGGATVLRSTVIDGETNYRGKVVLSDLLPGDRRYRYEIRIEPLTEVQLPELPEEPDLTLDPPHITLLKSA